MKYIKVALMFCLALVIFIGCSDNVEDFKDSTEGAQEPIEEEEMDANGEEEETTVEQEEEGEGTEKTEEVVLRDLDSIVLSDENLLTNLNATREAIVLNNYIREIYGDFILSGQQESTWMGTPEYEMNYILEETGKLPAIRGLDYIDEDFDDVTKRSIEWWEQGGIVTISWHWGTPPTGVGYESSLSTIDLNEALTEGTDLYNGMIVQMDQVAEELKILQAEGVPILWKPFHEFDGAWFWWGKGGPDNFIALWQLMYDRYTNHHGLDNLIWVLGYSGEIKPGWYPGDEYVDMAGSDSYSEGTGTRLAAYKKVIDIVGDEVPIAYHENGPIPDPDGMIRDGAKWSWFLTWHTMHIMEQNTPEYINHVYNHDYVITLEQLPDFKSYLEQDD